MLLNNAKGEGLMVALLGWKKGNRPIPDLKVATAPIITWDQIKIAVGQALQDEASRELELSDAYESGAKPIKVSWGGISAERYKAYMVSIHMRWASEADQASRLVEKMTQEQFIEYYNQKMVELRDGRLTYLPSK